MLPMVGVAPGADPAPHGRHRPVHVTAILRYPGPAAVACSAAPSTAVVSVAVTAPEPGDPSVREVAAASLVRVAWAAARRPMTSRTRPLSLPRQLRASQLVLPADALIVAHLYDIESGRTDLAAAPGTSCSASRSRVTVASRTGSPRPNGPTGVSTR